MILRFLLLAGTLILFAPFKPVICFLWNRYPIQDDFDQTYSLTFWIANITMKNIIEKYLILCPNQDMCLGPSFQRSYPFFEMPTCIPCDCDDSCVRRSTCCPSKFYRQTDTPDYITYHDDLNVIENEVRLSCMEPLWNPTGIKTGKSYWMIGFCPDKVNCFSPASENILSSTPVTSLITNQTYRNMQCAVCNQEEKSNLVFWQKKKLCSLRSALFSKENISSLYQSVFSPNPVCNIGFYPPTFIKDELNPCIEHTHEVKCNESNIKNDFTDSYLTKACQDFHLPFFFDDIVYKNIYCALCEHNIRNLPIQFSPFGFQTDDDFLPTPFSALIDFQRIPDEPIQQSLICANNQIFDNNLNKCLDIQCEAEYMYHNHSCRPVHQMVNENNYEINLIVSVDDNEIHPLNLSTTGIIEALQGILRHNMLERYLCRISVLGPYKSNDVGTAVVIELSINYLHNIDRMIEFLLKIFTSFHLFDMQVNHQNGSSVNLSFSLVGQSFHVYGGNFFSFVDRFFLHPMDGEEMQAYGGFIIPQEYDQQNCLKGHMMSIVADWYRCPKVTIKTADAKMDISNFSVCLVDYHKCFQSKYFKESVNKRSVSICIEQYLQSFKVINSSFGLSNESFMASLSLICLSLSSLGSLATLSTILFRGSCSRIADVNIIILASFIVIANIVYILSKFFLWSRTLCIGVGMVVHLSWLSVVCWMTLSSFQIFHAFTSLQISDIKVMPRVLYCLMLNLIICSSLVTINVIVSYVKSNGENLGYSLLSCYIADSDMILFTFAMPVGMLICINTFMFAVTVFRISKRIGVQKSQDKNKIGAYFRLSTITGVTWLFGFLGQFTGYQLFDILHTVFSGGQGLFLYMSFGFSFTTKQIHSSHSRDSKGST